MNGFSPEMLVLITGVFLLAGVIKGTVGIGLPTASVGMISQVMDPRLAIALVVFPSLLSNAWQIWRMGRFAATLRRYGIYIACLMGMIALVSMTVTSGIATETLMLVLGCVMFNRLAAAVTIRSAISTSKTRSRFRSRDRGSIYRPYLFHTYDISI